jgi:diguanylate cyclase (GGDEF)-like protein/PAS domain S-box-containing protein
MKYTETKELGYDHLQEGSWNVDRTNPNMELPIFRILRTISLIFELPAVFISSDPKSRHQFYYEGISEDLKQLEEIDQQTAFCREAVEHEVPFTFVDLLTSGRSANHSSGGYSDGIRSYAGIPLVARSGQRIGTFCVIDSQPRAFSSKDMELLQALSELVVVQVELQDEIKLRVETEMRLKNSEERYKTLVELSPEMMDVRHDGTILYMNPAGVHMLEAASQEQVIGKPVLDFIHPNDRHTIKQQEQEKLEIGMPSQKTEEKFVTLQGKNLDVEVKAIRIPYDGKNAILAVSRDITMQKRMEQNLLRANEQLTEIATVDGLTGVANRRRMDEFLKSEWSRSIRNSTLLSFIMLDIDFFKKYNDSYGHLIGDECLMAVAGAIRTGLSRPSDFLARYGGEEFAVILPETHLEGAIHVAERIRRQVDALAIPHSKSNIAKIITVSIGVSTMMGNIFKEATSLISTADKALYTSKRNGRNQVTSYKFE